MPGLALAKRAVEIYEKNPEVEALVLEKHGLFTFGDDAQTSYERHISIVARATQHLDDATEGRRPLGARAMVSMREAHEVAPLVRGALAEAVGNDRPLRRFILEHRSSDDILGFAAGGERALMLAEAPPITPDHVIRTKSSYLLVTQPPYGDMKALGQLLQHAVAEYRERYRAYFARNAAQRKGLIALDPTPRVVMLPGIGLFAAGENAQAARIAADIAEHTVRTKIRADAIGSYAGLSEAEIFEMEYWSLEQAKLGKRTPAPLEGQVALITGGAGAIGEGIARTLVAAGAHVVLADLDAERLERVAQTFDAQRCLAQPTDVTDERSVYEAFLAAAQRFGGVDIVVVNAGIAEAGALDVLTLERFDHAVDVNLRGAFITLREALAHFKLQGIGGNIVMLSTKNVFAPGAEFGAYSASKAGAHQLGRIAALEGAPHGVRVNMINADAIFGSAENPSGLWQSVGPARAKARGLDPAQLEEFYRSRNLLKVRVTAEQVGRAVVFFASQQTPTTGAVLPVDGGLPEAFPR
jgi:NAD(P)-dependent dehydrogenase (short-subunit alcohol dehydrogenase family)/ribulose-5-phosphate 4-epimerase/fuculose-1-phosphate aldolase